MPRWWRETLGDLNKKYYCGAGPLRGGVRAGILVTRVLYTKQTEQKRFIIVDAGMNDLIRPAMYDAWHSILPVRREGVAPVVADIVGPICESGDVFAKTALLNLYRAGGCLL